jgi:hypothetical protein
MEYVKEPNACYAAMRIVGLELNEKKGNNKKKRKGQAKLKPARLLYELLV